MSDQKPTLEYQPPSGLPRRMSVLALIGYGVVIPAVIAAITLITDPLAGSTGNEIWYQVGGFLLILAGCTSALAFVAFLFPRPKRGRPTIRIVRSERQNVRSVQKNAGE